MTTSNCTNLIEKAMKDVLEAISVNENDLRIRFSYVAEAFLYVDTGRMKLFGCKGTSDSLEKIEKEFPALHKAIVHIRKHKSQAKDLEPVCAQFEKFISTLRDIIDSDYMFLPTDDMVKERPEFKINNLVFDDLQKNMENGCKLDNFESISMSKNKKLAEISETAYSKITSLVNNLKTSSEKLWSLLPPAIA